LAAAAALARWRWPFAIPVGGSPVSTLTRPTSLPRGLSRQKAGIANIRFIEADLATLADDARAREIPEADVATLPNPERNGIVRLLAAKVRPGGLLQCAAHMAGRARHAAAAARSRGAARRAQ